MQFPSVGVVVKRSSDTMTIQPFQQNASETLKTLKLDLKTGNAETPSESPMTRNCTVVPGVMGILRMHKIAALVTIEEAKQVAMWHGHPVFQVTQTALHLPHGDVPSADREYVRLLRSAVDPQQYGHGLYFSYHSNLTLRTERAAAAKKENNIHAMWMLEDMRFFWNQHLMEVLIGLQAHTFVLPVIQGFVDELRGLDFSQDSGTTVMADMVLIARRSVRRLGTRNWRRGVDKHGAVANFVETEQLVSFSNGQKCSFVQLRGSIPVFWTSIPNVKYKAPTKVGREADYTQAFDLHIQSLLDTYKECVGVNLAHATGSEGKLTSAFSDATRRFSRNKNGFRLINFDFHKECGTTRYHRLSVLFDQIKDDLERFSQFIIANGAVTSIQKGVVRTNCIDCLDRTNVVQTVFGRYALESFLKETKTMGSSQSLPTAFPEVEARFKVIWADHGDAVSLQYSGTGALKSGFTRTGKRSLGGLIDDGVKSVTRYYLNNFEDGWKQDALDLVSGTFTVGKNTSTPSLQRSPDVLIYILMATLLYGLTQIIQGLSAAVKGNENVVGTLVTGVLCLLLAGYIVQGVMIRNGSLLVCKPRLRPDLPKQW